MTKPKTIRVDFTPRTPALLSTAHPAGLILDGKLVALVETPELAERLASLVEAPRWRKAPPTADEVRSCPYWWFRCGKNRPPTSGHPLFCRVSARGIIEYRVVHQDHDYWEPFEFGSCDEFAPCPAPIGDPIPVEDEAAAVHQSFMDETGG